MPRVVDDIPKEVWIYGGKVFFPGYFKKDHGKQQAKPDEEINDANILKTMI